MQKSPIQSPFHSPRRRDHPLNPTPTRTPTTSAPTTPRAGATPGVTLSPPSAKHSSKRHRSRSSKVLRSLRSAFRSLPILNPTCRFPAGAAAPHHLPHDGHIHGATRVTGTLFGPRRARISLAVQDTPRSLPFLVLELGVPTGKLLQDIGAGLARIALECERRAGGGASKMRLLEEPMWTMYCNGRKTGYGARREPTEGDLHVMQLLHTVSMGAGVLPGADGGAPEAGDGELTYMRACFDRVVGSKDSETFYMLNPDSSSGPDLSIFFIRI